MKGRTYSERIEELYTRVPRFQEVGQNAHTGKLDNIIKLCNFLGNPQDQFKSIHIAGTNGKGSTTHMLASALIAHDLKVGLYTSPHLLNFRERIKIGKLWIEEHEVLAFLDLIEKPLNELPLSFFEVTVAMAFYFFKEQKVDYAIIETGLGGRLDSTNIINPVISVITNIGLDHQKFLGNDLESIAGEKAGIIKSNIPIIISETQKETTSIFLKQAKQKNAPILFSDQDSEIVALSKDIRIDLKGKYQRKNLCGVIGTILRLSDLDARISLKTARLGLSTIQDHTAFLGRYQILNQNPKIIGDLAHNLPGMQELVENIQSEQFKELYIIIGAVKDKDIQSMVSILPKESKLILTQPSNDRALDVNILKNILNEDIRVVTSFENVDLAINYALKQSNEGDLIVICGSAFLLADLGEKWLLN